MSEPTEPVAGPDAPAPLVVSGSPPTAMLLANAAIVADVAAVAVLVVLLGRRVIGVQFNESQFVQWTVATVLLQVVGISVGFVAFHMWSGARKRAGAAMAFGAATFALFFLYSLAGSSLTE